MVSQVTGGNTLSGIARYKQYILVALLVLSVSVLVYFGYYFFSADDINRVPSGTKQKATTVSESSPNTLRCVKICEASRDVGFDLNKGLCLDSNLDGYACAVVVADKGHCRVYYNGVEEIVLNEKCEFVGVFKYEGDKN